MHRHTGASPGGSSSILRQLHQLHARFNDIVERTTDGVLVVDRGGTILYANPAATTMLGSDGLVGRTVGLPVGTAETEIELLAPSGAVRYAEMRVVAATEWDGRPVSLALLRDVTDRHQAELELIRLNAELLRSNRDLETFAGILAHDLKQPLAEVVGNLHLLALRMGDGDGDGDVLQLLQSCLARVSGMGEFIDAILDHARPGALGAPQASVDCASVVQHCATGLADRTGTVVIGDLPTLRSDPHLLHQIFQNLVTNGIKHRRPGAEPRVEVTAERGDGHWTFVVADDGPGIPAEQRERVFDAYWRPPDHDRPGHGIGLAACRAAVERLGGRIWVEDAATGGSRFCFTVPDA